MILMPAPACASCIASFSFSGTREISLDDPRESEGLGERLVADMPSPAEEAARRERQAILQKGFAALPERDRVVLTLRYQERWSFEAVGERLGLSADAVRRLCPAIMKKLAATLGPLR